MTDYETLRRGHLADAMALAPQLIERLDWSAERLRTHRVERLRDIVGHAARHSRWHRDRLSGIDLDRLDLESLREIPPMTKADLMANFDGIVTDRRLSLERVNSHLDTVDQNGYLLDRYTALTSGGSSGQRGVFVYDWEGWATLCVTCLRQLLRAKRADPELSRRPVVLAWVMAEHFSHATAAIARTFNGPDLVCLRFPVTLPLEEIVAGLNRAQPDAINVYPSALHLLSFEAQAGRLRITPRRVLSAAEPLLPEIRAAAEAAWGVRVGNLYGISEGGAVAAPCGRQRSHLSEDLVIVEPVDERGRPVPAGERSAKIYLTNLYNRAMPLIRYEVTDHVTVLREPCPCGAATACVADIEGRLDDDFAYGRRRIGAHVFRSALGRRAGIVEYQVRQTRHGARIAVRCQGPVDIKGLACELESGLSRLGLERPEVRIEVVDRLARNDGASKLKRFVPLNPPALGKRPGNLRRGREQSPPPAAHIATS